jgi:hypothetical protein
MLFGRLAGWGLIAVAAVMASVDAVMALGPADYAGIMTSEVLILLTGGEPAMHDASWMARVQAMLLDGLGGGGRHGRRHAGGLPQAPAPVPLPPRLIVGPRDRKKAAPTGAAFFMPYQSSPILRAARKADWGISTRPNWRMRFLPSFCFSSSLRLRLTSPP